MDIIKLEFKLKVLGSYEPCGSIRAFEHRVDLTSNGSVNNDFTNFLSLVGIGLSLAQADSTIAPWMHSI